ncbi:hypothetical protein T484DRAFT_1809452 [Baffinella frigidus]|nr:hypothetical protein T484DRAFT_1809452 [Cryptophyta sp. CCMP2293]|mmetsp:Transcript_38526/g.87829  ORF Transcript_38526/g.87829 Transcript_38526/m.87829 type:complete len:197 (-) Transcript_38526:238-828(-)
MVGKGKGTSHALAAFHHAVAVGDLESVKNFTQGAERKPGHLRIAVNTQDEDGLAAIHWAAMKGHKDVIKYLVEAAPENNRADPCLADKDSWTPLLWAIFMAEQVVKEGAKRKAQNDVINYLMSNPAVVEMVKKPDRLLHKTPEDWAREVAVMSDEGIMKAMACKWEANRQYGPVKTAGHAEDQDDDDDGASNSRSE